MRRAVERAWALAQDAGRAESPEVFAERVVDTLRPRVGSARPLIVVSIDDYPSGA